MWGIYFQNAIDRLKKLITFLKLLLTFYQFTIIHQ